MVALWTGCSTIMIQLLITHNQVPSRYHSGNGARNTNDLSNGWLFWLFLILDHLLSSYNFYYSQTSVQTVFSVLTPSLEGRKAGRNSCYSSVYVCRSEDLLAICKARQGISNINYELEAIPKLAPGQSSDLIAIGLKAGGGSWLLARATAEVILQACRDVMWCDNQE